MEDEALEKIRRLWRSTEEGHRQPNVAQAEELDFFLASTVISLRLRIDSLKAAARSRGAVRTLSTTLDEIEKEVELCAQIAQHTLKVRRAQEQNHA